MPSLNWNDLRFVLAVARARSIAPAAKSLHVNATTVLRRIRRVEQTLGTKLFEADWRTTEAATTLIQRAERIEAEAGAIADHASGIDATIAGNVRVTAIPLIASRLLVPGLRALCGSHPDLILEVIAEPRNLSVMQRDADIALRLARPDREQRVIARRIAVLTYAVYGPARGNASRLPWITYEDGMAALPHVAWINRATNQDARAPGLIVNDSALALSAIKQGLGKSLLPSLIGDREPGIRRLSVPSPMVDRELWLLVNPSYRHLARIKAVIAWIEDLLR